MYNKNVICVSSALTIISKMSLLSNHPTRLNDSKSHANIFQLVSTKTGV